MNSLKELSLKEYACDLPPTNKTLFWDTFGSISSPKYRTIPVSKTIGAVQITALPIENVSGVKELTNLSNFTRSNIFYEATNATAKSNVLSETPKKTTNTNAAKSANPSPHQVNSIHSFVDKVEQVSWSEPNLAIANDRGDSTEFQDTCTEENTTLQNICKQTPSRKEQVMRGCIYIKNSGNIYKSVIEANKLEADEKYNFRNNLPIFTQLRSSTSKNIPDKNIFRKNGFKFQANEMGDFEIAIYLSGLTTADGKHHKEKMMDFGKVRRSKCEVQCDRVRKKKSSHVGKSGLNFGKSYEIVNQAHTNPSKLRTAKQCRTSRISRCETRSSYQINKRPVELEFPGDDSSAEYELDDSGTIISKRKVIDILNNSSSNVRNPVKPSDSGQLSYRSRKTGRMNTRSKFVSQSSLSGNSDGYGMHKPKVTDEDMWETFDMIFRSYASTSRHSGEVIPRKISTEWMINAGVVNEIMTQKEADDAFRSIAGTKITMNAQEYKDFLISLSLKMKLPYYEIYRRMCGM